MTILSKIMIAIATKGSKGLKDKVSEVFGRAPTFTLVTVEDGVIKNTKVIENPAAPYEFGVGPIVVKMLSDKRVKVVAGAEFGVGISTLLKDKDIRIVKVKPEMNVCDVVDTIIKQVK